MNIAVANECETLIVGAFGCGRLGWSAEHVAGLFKAWIDEHPGALGRVVFAVPRASFDAFDALFGKLEEAAPAVTEAVVDEDDDEFDLSSIELPEGITLR